MWADGTRYIGDFLLGEYCGKGKLKFNHGRGHALGDFYYGRLHGVATREYMNGNVYEGSFRYVHIIYLPCSLSCTHVLMRPKFFSCYPGHGISERESLMAKVLCTIGQETSMWVCGREVNGTEEVSIQRAQETSIWASSVRV